MFVLDFSLALQTILITILTGSLWTLRCSLSSLVSRFLLPSRKSRAWSIPLAVNSFQSYERAASSEVDIMRIAYNKLGLSRRRISEKLGYPAKLNRLRDTNRVNGDLTRAIAALAVEDYGRDADTSRVEVTEIGRVREALKHFVRDWGEEGEEERRVIFAPILEELSKIPEEERLECSILLPGAGLGRLAWDISRLGFETTAVELSPYMFLALRLLLSPNTTSEINQHTAYPHAHWFSHRRTNEDLFRPMAFPDALPRLDEQFYILEGDFLDLVPAPSSNPILRALPSPVPVPPPTQNRSINTPKSYTHLISLFFIDTSPNILATLSQIHSLLKPGGVWINLGPLLWSSGGSTAMELSLEEVLRATESCGFQLRVLNPDGVADDLVERTTRKVECEYTADKRAMMRWIYEARFWIAEKV